jgi:pentatricopeptide repeat protein
MQATGVEADASFFNHLMRGCAAAGQWELSAALLEHLQVDEFLFVCFCN